MSTSNPQSDSAADVDDGPTTALSEHGRPKRVQWASKTRVEHVEQVPVRDDDEPRSLNAEPRSLDEYAEDPTALERLHRALEPLQHQPDAQVDAELAEQRLWESRARDIIRAHSHGSRDISNVSENVAPQEHWRFFRHKRTASPVSSEKQDEDGRNHQSEDKREHDIEASAQESPNIAPLPLGRGRGVLSTLLTLYDSQSASESTNSSVSSSRSSSPHPPSPSFKKRSKYHVPLRSSASIPHSLRMSPVIQSRPKAARNSGGVVGSLIATSGNITGAASPAHSSIGPDVKRPGWRLTRYALAPEDTLHRPTHSAPTTPLPGSHEDYFSAPIASGSSTPTPTASQDGSPPASLRRTSRLPWDWIRASSSEGGSRPSSPSWWPSSSPKNDTPPGIGGGTLGSADGNGKAYRRGKKDRRRKAEIYITKHVAEIMQRQEFLLKLARALMMFAAPTHRLQAQLQATARVLDLDMSSLYLPNVMLIAFGDDATGTSNLKFIQQPSSLDLGKLLDAHRLYWKVTHDKISVSSASASLDVLMRLPALYPNWQIVLIGGMCSGAICPLAFYGSFVDSLMAIPLGALLVFVQNFSSRNELYSNVFEITIATLLSFVSAGLASTSRFCYAALASSSVVLILPGFIVLSGSLELASRQIVSGAVRVCFAVIYSLFLGFGLAMGADVYSSISGLPVVGPDDFACVSSHQADGPWWQRTPSIWWAFLCVPLYSLALSLRNQAPLLRKELPVTVLISCGGWAANHFSGLKFPGRPDIQSALGAFAVGIVANIYARFFSGNAYVVMITGILFQLPSGLANGGLLTFAAVDNMGQQFQSYQAGFQVALQLVAVAIGLTVGLFTSVVVVHPLGGSRRRAAGLFSL